MLTYDEILNGLKNLPGWTFQENYIGKTFTFKNFLEGIEFVNKIAEKAESLNHHPDILIFSYNKVKIKIFTHSAGGVTEKDLQLANQIENIDIK